MIASTCISNLPFWWLDTAFGKLVFSLFFITWGLIIIALVLLVLLLVRQLFGTK